VKWLKWTGLAFAGAAAFGAGVQFYGAARWNRASASLLDRIEAARSEKHAGSYDIDELDGLPAPVQRYLRAVLPEGQQQVISAVSLSHQGQFNLAADGENWKPFTSTQRVVTQRPGFLWDAAVMMMPGLPVRVRDAYIAGTGLLNASLAGVYPVAHMTPSGELDRGELMRYLAEAAWYPTALLPSQGIRWEAVDDHAARATLTDGAVSVSLLFRFGADGLIEAVSADRGRSVGQDIVITPWEGRWSGYHRRDGMLVPLEGEVAWLTAEGRMPYWRGKVLALEYEPRR
jgi:hypothetical protein